MIDVNMLQKIQTENENGTTHLYYHNTCQTSYFGKFSNNQTKAKTNTQETIRNIHKEARERLFQYVEEEIINNRKVFSLTHLKHCFVTFSEELHEIGNFKNDSLFHLYNIRTHLEKQFKRNIRFVYLNKKLYIMSAQMDIHDASDEEIRELIFEQEAVDFALKYRSHLLKIKSHPLLEYLNNEALQKGECEIPRWLRLFWTKALSGVNDKHNDRIDRLASNFSQDSIYAVNRGRIKPSKHILLGITMKSLTGSEKIITILNRLGYCISYSTLVELETSAAYSSVSNKTLCPSGIYPTIILPSGIAWDNFDRYVETCGKRTVGKDTLHDTVGIIYQSVPTEEELNLIQLTDNNRSFENMENVSINIRDERGRRKRSFAPEYIENLQNAKQSRPEFWQSSIASIENPVNMNTFKKINFFGYFHTNSKYQIRPCGLDTILKI